VKKKISTQVIVTCVAWHFGHAIPSFLRKPMPTTKSNSAVIKPPKPVPVLKEVAPPKVNDPAPKNGGVAVSPLEEMLVRAGIKCRTSLEKHLALCDAEPAPFHGQLWRQLAGKLGKLAPMPVQMAGAQAVMFYVADGKYRLQVFALEDLNDGNLSVYLPDILADAVKAKILKKAGGRYIITAHRKQVPLVIETINAANTPDPAPHVKHMIGWNRKAIKVTIDARDADDSVAAATESLCELAAKRWQISVA
jgi:hypothetical protein